MNETKPEEAPDKEPEGAMPLRGMAFAIDFDGTCVVHNYPHVGRNIGAERVLRRMAKDGAQILLFTMRSGKGLDDAVQWFHDNEVPLHGIQKSPKQTKGPGAEPEEARSPEANDGAVQPKRLDPNRLLQVARESPEDLFLEWSEPWEGLDGSGAKVVADVTMRASAKDCIAISRLQEVGVTGHLDGTSDEDKLLDFIAVHWATADPMLLRERDENEWKPDYSVAPRRVVCAAIRNRRTGRIITGARHFDKIMRDQINSSEGIDSWKGNSEQGFIDQFGDYLTREEAHEIATAQGQIYRRCGGDEESLYSENLY